MAGQTISNSETKIEALRLQSSAYGVTIPLVFGRTRISGNLLDYLGFEAVPHTEEQGGKGGGVKIQNTTYTYRASVMMGLCHGPITEIPTIWRGKSQYSGGWEPTQISVAVETYTVPASGAMAYTVANAATWLAIVSVVYPYESSTESGSTSWPLLASLGTQYTVNAGVVTVLDENLRGLVLTITYQWASGIRPTTAMEQLGLTLKAGNIGQAAWSALPSGHDIGYSGLALVAGQAYDLGTGAQVENHMFEVIGPMAYHLGTSVPDVDPALMLRAVLTQLQGGAGFPAQQIDDWQAWSDYCVAADILVSPAMTAQASAADIVRQCAELTNTAPVWSGGRLKMVPLADQAETAHGRTYTPSSTPVYDLDDESYVPARDGSPIAVKLKNPDDRFNHWRVEFLNRGNQYNGEIAEAKDPADIDANGTRSADVVQAHWLCTPAAARKVAQTLLQRSLYVNAEYTVPLPWHYALLEPADLVTLTDTTLQMDRLPVRITVVEENEDGDLTITAEDYPPATASAAVYPTQAGSGYNANYNADPGDVDTPAIFEAPYTLAVTGLEVYVAVRGLTTLWGGCQVWVSLDGTSYRQVGVVYGGARYGTLSAAITSGATSMGVQGLATAQLLSGSATDAAALQTLCYIGGAAQEYVAYEGATLVSAGAYTLGSLVRGGYGTTAAAHASGSSFVRVDDRIAKSGPLELGLIGSTINFKFTSFNIWGQGQQGLADVSAVPYTITGDQYNLAPPPSGGSPSPSLVLTPASVTLQADVDGQVTDFSAAKSTATVIESTGTDVTAAWTFTKADTGVVSTLSGTLGNILTVTGYDPSGVASNWAGVVLQLHLNGSWADSSRYGRTINNINPGTTFAAGAPFSGAYAGRQVARYDTNTWSYCNNIYGPDPSIRKTGGPWSVRCRVRFSALPPSVGAQFTFCGNDFGSFYATRVSGGTGLCVGYIWNGSTGSSPPNVVSPSVSGGTISTGVWYALEFSYGADGHCRLFIDGALIATTITPNTARTDDISVAQAAKSLYFNVGTNFIEDPGFGGACILGDICDVQLIKGTGGHTSAYMLETYPLPDGPYLPYATVAVTSHKAGSADITRLFEVTTIQPAPRTVTCAFSPAALVLAGDEDGVVASIGSYAATVQVLVDNALDSTGYAISSLQYSAAGITATYSGQTVTLSAWPASLASGNITATLVRSGFPTKQAILNISRTVKPRKAQTWQQDKTVLIVAGETNGHVPAASYTGLTVTMTPLLAGVADSLANWTFSRTSSSGITTTISTNTVTLTALTDAVDTGYIDITATPVLAGYTAMTARVAVTKTKLLPQSGVAPPTSEVFLLASTNTGSASATIQLLPDGTIDQVLVNGSPSPIQNWFTPTTSAVGNGYWVRADVLAGLPVSTGTTGTWQQLDTTRSWSRAVVSSGAGFVSQTRLRIRIATDSAGATVVGSFTCLLQTYSE